MSRRRYSHTQRHQNQIATVKAPRYAVNLLPSGEEFLAILPWHLEYGLRIVKHRSRCKKYAQNHALLFDQFEEQSDLSEHAHRGHDQFQTLVFR